ncbi:MAG TPA: thiosulfate oxidation carrier protein SoxY [Gammaproteobacteria bacterium]|nr:thiosulfate oxidation carrier protein SoxY [Gammaproteobacteria bacterium]
MKRRTLLKSSLTAGVAGIAAGAGLLTPQVVMAAWPKSAFKSKTIDNAVKNLLGSSGLATSGDITIKAPPIAENGAVVNIAVTSKLKNVSSISILVEKNAQPLTSSFNLSSVTEPFVKTRVKIAKTSRVLAVVKSGGKLYSASREVKVTIGGCGG